MTYQVQFLSGLKAHGFLEIAMKQKIHTGFEKIAPLILPIALLYETAVSKRAVGKKIVYILIVLLLFTWIYTDAIRNTIYYTSQFLLELGLTDSIVESKTQGPSMLPTLSENDSIKLSNPKKVGIDRGDIVTFSNTETEGLSYIKRVVGLPGENISIKQGAVWINGKPLKEPYVYQGRPTFGNTYLEDCDEEQIPVGSFAVMGDNRGVSWDSRAIGFIQEGEINGVKKSDSQTEFYENEGDLAQFDQKDFDILSLIKALNAKRSEKAIPPLITNSDVENAAKTRSGAIVADFAGYKTGTNTVEKTLENGNYRYNLLHEYTTFGYLDADEVVDQIFDNPEEINLFLSDRFTEIGVGVTNRTNGTCTYPVISIVLSWPSVATYNKDIIDGWARDASVLTQSINNYQTWVGFPEKDQDKLKELISISSQMAVIASRINTRMVNREYLTAEDYNDIKRYNTTLLPKENQLYAELFGNNVQGAETSVDSPREAW